MNFNEYQELSKRTMPNENMKKVSANYALGLTGESGEVADIIKKWVFHKHDLDRMELEKELGDVLHYLSGLATLHHFNLEDVAQANIDKLKKRYPEGFSSEASRNRTV
ncbi:nucleoside triphosphate pyrophosphohydrolase family protein [Virgibacillus halodenitrificans]|uniref:nucleoside triphosphate pyrophosphohydrolase family protein n=1 Tax=Virgibacillus halodenitrificans TaxID=1482 RepID=UPI001F339016|nr:nucleoside triphosphate pyrophosphohydrolase family protein [Virgibacillus halodenitrificans]MCG1029295.1 nucleoside triphosphate pyrophosphohydrolase family protein [Virgibacillus halodenitrificans]